MKDFEKILKALECCAFEEKPQCDECPYNENNCRQKDRDARALIEEMKAQKELAYLRAIKATAEAFLGVKIDGQM